MNVAIPEDSSFLEKSISPLRKGEIIMAPPQPEPIHPAETAAKAFISCLTDESTYYLLHLPAGHLSPDQVASLRRIYEHFCQQSSEKHGDTASSLHADQVLIISDDDDDSARPSTPQNMEKDVKKAGPGRPRKAGGTPTPNSILSSSWGAIMVMQDCKLDPLLQRRLKTIPNDDAARFLPNPLPLLGDTDQQFNPTLEAFTRFCLQVEKMPHATVDDHIQWLFLVLAAGDMGNLLFGREGSWKESQASASIIAKEGNDAWKDSRSTIAIAKSLVFICSKLGNGCLFWLHRELTKNFLLHRVTRAGNAYERAMQHLSDVGLYERIKGGDTERVGDAIRVHLQERYQLRQLISDDAEINDVSGDE